MRSVSTPATCCSLKSLTSWPWSCARCARRSTRPSRRGPTGRSPARPCTPRSDAPNLDSAPPSSGTSPTGSGKTLAAFLPVFDHLARARATDALSAGIVAVYVSPLRALAYDLRKNLEEPLRELGWDWLRVAARTGDTTPTERAQQRRKPPHILVTTPESLTLLLSQPNWIPALRSVRFLIVDELHALAENKRGSLQMVAAERLEELLTSSPAFPSSDLSSPISARSTRLTRVGLSATVAPLETVAAFLVGPGRDCVIATAESTRPARIEVFSPLRRQAYPPAGYTATRVLKELGALLVERRTTLIFTNTRSGAETIGLRLKQLLPELSDLIEVHHASLDRAVRLEVEDRLKRGELRAVVCATSLEMGIDIGSIDTVVMVSAPRGVARARQWLAGSTPDVRRFGQEIKQDRQHCIYREKLDAFEPVALAVARNLPGYRHRHHDGHDLGNLKFQIHGAAEKVGRENQHRRHEQRDLQAGPDRDTDT